MSMSAVPLEVKLSNLVIDAAPFTSGATAEIYKARYAGSEMVFKKPIEGEFAINGLSQEQQLLLSVAISQVYHQFLPEHALIYSVVKDEAGKPVGLMAPFVEMERIVANDDEDGATLSDTRKRVAPMLFTRNFGYLLAIAYCLKENDFNGGNFVATAAGVMKIDHDRSLLAESTYMPDQFALSKEAFEYFPFFEKKSEYSPETFIHNTDYNLVKVFKEYLQGDQAEKVQAFVEGMSDGFKVFARQEDLVGDLRRVLSPLFSEAEISMLDDLLMHVHARQGAIKEAVSEGYVDNIAKAYGASLGTRPRSASLDSVDGLLPLGSPATTMGASPFPRHEVGASAASGSLSTHSIVSPAPTTFAAAAFRGAIEGLRLRAVALDSVGKSPQ